MYTNFILLQNSTDQNTSIMNIVFIILLVVIFYFFMIRPQSKRQKEIRKFREGIKKGDSVVTAGGIYARVKEVKDTAFMLEIANGVTIKIDKNSVYPSVEQAQQSSNDQNEPISK